MTGALTFAFGTGLLATVNPCGFVMLPGFVGMQLAMTGADAERSPLSRLMQGLGVGLVLSGAFSGVLMLAGLVLAAGLRSLIDAVPWLVVAVGAVLVLAGIATLAGRHIGIGAVAPLRPVVDWTGEHRYRGAAAFGVGYAVASLSCTLAVVLSVATQATATSNPVQGLAVLIAFAAGATSALLALTLSIALARTFVAHAMRRIAAAMETVAGAMLTASGAYLIAYWFPRLLDSRARPGGPIGEAVERASSAVTDFLAHHTGAFAIALAAIAAAAAVVLAMWGRADAPAAHHEAHIPVAGHDPDARGA